MPIDLRFLRVQDGTTSSILHSSNHSGDETSLKTWIRTRNRFGKSRKLLTQEESNELYNIKCGGIGYRELEDTWETFDHLGNCFENLQEF